MRDWRIAERFLSRLYDEPVLHDGYERAIASLFDSLQSVVSLDTLISQYCGSADVEQLKFRTAKLKQVCKTAQPAGEERLAPKIVEDVAYYRRAKLLLSRWWEAGTST